MKKMTEKETWLYLAECWDNAKVDEDGDCAAHDAGYEQWGLCISTGDLEQSGRITLEMESYMDDGVVLFRGKDTPYYWPRTKEGAVQRTWAYLFLAAMCE